MHLIVAKVLAAPLLIAGTTVAGRRWGHRVSGWLVAIPFTSAPVAYFLALEHGSKFMATAAVGMLGGTASQVAFAEGYRSAARRGWRQALVVATAFFAAITSVQSVAQWSVWSTAALVLGALSGGAMLARTRGIAARHPQANNPPREDSSEPMGLPARIVVATGLVVTLTALAPVLGARLAGLVSPFPVYASVTVVFDHRRSGIVSALEALDGLMVGLFTPATFFLALALLAAPLGLWAFGVALLAAGSVQFSTLSLVRSRSSERPSRIRGFGGVR